LCLWCYLSLFSIRKVKTFAFQASRFISHHHHDEKKKFAGWAKVFFALIFYGLRWGKLFSACGGMTLSAYPVSFKIGSRAICPVSRLSVVKLSNPPAGGIRMLQIAVNMPML